MDAREVERAVGHRDDEHGQAQHRRDEEAAFDVAVMRLAFLLDRRALVVRCRLV